jgi:hypothetical protein
LDALRRTFAGANYKNHCSLGEGFEDSACTASCPGSPSALHFSNAPGASERQHGILDNDEA